MSMPIDIHALDDGVHDGIRHAFIALSKRLKASIHAGFSFPHPPKTGS
nr:unnamed protein product [uncultured bacterium]